MHFTHERSVRAIKKRSKNLYAIRKEAYQMKILDTRIRPPYRSIKKQLFFDPTHTKPFMGTFDMEMSPSAVEKSMEMLLDEMQQAGVSKAFTPFNNRGVGMDNEDYALLNQEYPDRFIGFVGLNPMASVQKSLEDIDRYVLQGEFTGVNLEPGLDQVPWEVDNEYVFPIYEKCQAHNIPVYMTWGGLLSVPWAYAPNRLDTVARTFPKMKLFLSHGGFPRNAETCVIAMNHDNVFIGPDIYMYNAFGSEDYVMAANYRLRTQICFGSIYPYGDVITMVNHFLHCGIREEVLPDIMYHNAVRFAGIE